MLPLLCCVLLATVAIAQDRPPNVVVIVSDDAGYLDFSMQGSKQIRTPRIDSIAATGIRFRQGYVTASVCSPSRAGLMTGRYQQRFGHELNIPARYSEENGMSLDEVTIADALKSIGHRTIALGKWHLGYAPKFHPLSRGFDDYYGFLQGARSFYPLKKPTRLNRLLRDRKVLPESGITYMTDSLGEEAAKYVVEHAKEPFFLYLAFNAVHTPMHAKPEVLEAVKVDAKPKRKKLIAMTHSLDEAIGRVLDALQEAGVADDTLLFFVNDNGGATNNASKNGHLRGKKGSPFEGGIRVPFVVQWPKGLPKGVVYDEPVSTFDILPTAMAACGGGWRPKNPLDGVDLLPFLREEKPGRPHDVMFWRRRENKVVRKGDLKLVSTGGEWMLFDMANDESEEKDLAGERAEDVAVLAKLYGEWDAQLETPRWRYGRRRKK